MFWKNHFFYSNMSLPLEEYSVADFILYLLFIDSVTSCLYHLDHAGLLFGSSLDSIDFNLLIS